MSQASATILRPPPRGGRPERTRAPIAPLIALVLIVTPLLAILQVPAAVLAVPAAFLVSVVAARHPAGTALAVFVATGAIGTLTAFTPLRVIPAADFALACLWLAAAGTYLFGRPERRPWLWPALVAPGLYLAITALQVPLAEPVELGVRSFRAAAWYMAAFLLVALAPWGSERYARIARGTVVIALLVGAYSAFRWLTGVSAEEYAAQRAAAPRLDDRFAGSLLSGNQLSAWCGTVIPFVLALALAWRGRWRLAAIAAIGLLAVALLASDVRGGTAAAVAGVLLVLLLHQLSPAFPGRFAVGLLTLLTVGAIAAGAWAVAVEDSPRADRLESLLEPSQDVTYSERLKRWETAVEVMEDEPLGLGLGTAGEVAVQRNEAGSAVDPDLDSSYLKIGLEQGVPVLVLFAFGMAGLLAGLAVRAVRATEREGAAHVIGAAGTLAALLVLFYSGLYIEGMPIVMAWMLVGVGAAAVTTRPDAG